MTDDMTDKIAVIAGGSPEVAEATARLLATRRAAGLMVCGRGAERGQALAAIISAAGCPTHFLPVDLARAQDCAAVIAEADLVFGRIDAPEKLDQLLAVKVRAPFLLLQGAASMMRRTGVHGTLIITIGGTGGNGPRTLAAVAGRGALAAMARGFAESLAANRIHVFGLVLDDERTGAVAPPAHVARAIAELAAGDASTASGSSSLRRARPAGDRPIAGDGAQSGAIATARPSRRTALRRPPRSTTTTSAAAPGSSRPRSASPR
jgi:NAD(P)-dependent dehydrogenase (short-subunit alcohol dehydrogenase family)